MIDLQSSEKLQQELPEHAATPARNAVGIETGNVRAPSSLRATVRGDTLHVPTFACGRCHGASQQAGSGWIRRPGLCIHVCAACKPKAKGVAA